MAVLAHNCSNIRVTVVDINEKQISRWNDPDLSKLPVYEPGLAEIISKTRFKNLYFSSNVEQSIKEADIIFISVNTPTKMHGIGSGQASDLRWVESSARLVSKYARGYTIVVEKSTVPVRTGAKVEAILTSTSQNIDNETLHKSFDVLSNPEFLAEGTAIEDLQTPDRVLIGGKSEKAINALSEIYKNWVPEEKIIKTNLWSSELSKLSANAFLAQRVSSINAISGICEVTGADINEVANSIGKDNRIGTKFLRPGPGFGGSCFKKDILNLVYLCEHYGLYEIANYWKQVVEINNYQQERVFRIVVNKLFGTVANKKITILGFAFKANTNDTRESPSINICKKLIEEGAHLSINDPKVTKNKIINELGIDPIEKNCTNYDQLLGSWSFEPDIYKALHSSDAVLILCDWEIYYELKWSDIIKGMRKPSWIFDTRNVVSSAAIEGLNINLWRLGQG